MDAEYKSSTSLTNSQQREYFKGETIFHPLRIESSMLFSLCSASDGMNSGSLLSSANSIKLFAENFLFRTFLLLRSLLIRFKTIPLVSCRLCCCVLSPSTLRNCFKYAFSVDPVASSRAVRSDVPRDDELNEIFHLNVVYKFISFRRESRGFTPKIGFFWAPKRTPSKREYSRSNFYKIIRSFALSRKFGSICINKSVFSDVFLC